jgi:hypothetical protein
MSLEGTPWFALYYTEDNRRGASAHFDSFIMGKAVSFGNILFKLFRRDTKKFRIGVITQERAGIKFAQYL